MTYPQQYPPQQYMPPPVPPRQKPAGFAVTALVLGIVGVVLSFMPILNNVTAAGAVVGLVLGTIGVWKSRLVMSTIGAGLCVFAVVLTIVAQQQLSDELDKIGDSGDVSPARQAAEPRTPNTPETPVDSWPSADELIVDLRVTDKQCFGSAGCVVTVQPELTYTGAGDADSFDSYSVTVSVTGDESGEVITTLDVTGSDYTVMPVFLSTKSAEVAPAAKVISVQ